MKRSGPSSGPLRLKIEECDSMAGAFKETKRGAGPSAILDLVFGAFSKFSSKAGSQGNVR